MRYYEPNHRIHNRLLLFAIQNQLNVVQIFKMYSFNVHFHIIVPSTSLQRDVFISGFVIKILYAFLSDPKRTTFDVLLIHTHVITL